MEVEIPEEVKDHLMEERVLEGKQEVEEVLRHLPPQ